MSPEHIPQPGKILKSVKNMDYRELAGIAVNYDTVRNLRVVEQELLRRSANDGVKEDPLYVKTWQFVQSRLLQASQDS